MEAQNNNPLSDGEKAYIKMLELHITQTSALLSDIGGTKPGEAMGARELAIAHTSLETAFFHAREYILRRHVNRTKLH